MEPIQIIGGEQLDKTEKEDIKRIANEYFTKIQRQLKNIESLIIHIKEYNKQGTRKKFSLHIRAIAPTRIFEADAVEWELHKALYKAFEKLETELEHHFHTSDQHKHSGSKISRVLSPLSWFSKKK